MKPARFTHLIRIDPGLALGVAGVCVGFLGCLGSLPRLASRKAEAPATTVSAPPATEPEGIEDLAWSPDGRRLAAVVGDRTICTWGFPGGAPELNLRVPARMFELNARFSWVSWSPDGRTLSGSSFSDLTLLWDSRTGRLRDVLRDAKWSPDGKILAVLSYDRKSVVVRDAVTGERLAAHPAMGGLDDLASWSPDSRWLAFETPDGCALWSRASGILPARLELGSWISYNFAWSPDAKWLATCGQESGISEADVTVWSTTTGQRHALLNGRGNDAYECQWSPDGRTLAVGHGDHTVFWDLRRRRRTPLNTQSWRLSGADWGADGRAWSPDGRTYLTFAPESDSGRITFWETTTARPRRSLTYRGSQYPVVGPGSRKIAVIDGDDVLVCDAATGRVQHRLRSGDETPSRPIWSPDGSMLGMEACAPGHPEQTQLQIWVVETGRRLATLEVPVSPSGDAAPVWSPDSQRLAARGPEGRVRVWDRATGARPLILTPRD